MSEKIHAKALITGASGFIGSRLRDTLLERGADVLAIRRKGSPPAKKGRSVEAEYDDLEGLTKLVESEKPDLVFHVAGATKGVTYEDFRRANVMPTRNLLEAVARSHRSLSRFVHVSSLTSYGPSAVERPHVETDPRRPIEFYGQSKLEAEHAVEASRDVSWTILRPGGVYGPGDVDYFEIFKSIAKNGISPFYGNRNRWWSAIHVDDFVEATLRAATSEATVGRGYFVCDNDPMTWERFQQEITSASGRRVMEVPLPEVLTSVAASFGELATKLDGKPRLFNRQKAKMGAQEAWTCKSDAIRSDTGWAHQFPMDRGVRETLDWYRREKWI